MSLRVRDRLRTKYRAIDALNKEIAMALAVPEVPMSAIPGVPDDIADPPVPPGAYAPLPPVDGAFQAALLEEVQATIRVLDNVCTRFDTKLGLEFQALKAVLIQHQTTISASEASALEHLCETLQAVQTQGITVLSAPYQAQVAARMPSGFFVTVAIAHRDGAAFLEALGKLEQWLLASNYAPVTA